MEKSVQLQNGNKSKGNSEDSLLVIYILHILKKYSSSDNQLSTQNVMEYLKKDYSIDKSEALRKKVRRHLVTLHESYWGGCIKMTEGKTRNGHKWYYDAFKDKTSDEEPVSHESLTETEVELLVDLISSTKILNSYGTRGLIDKLLKKTTISAEDRARRLGAIQKEAWLKSPNEDLAGKKEYIEDYFYSSNLVFDYEDEESVTATPLGWIYEDGICYLDAKVKGEYRKFSLDKIRIYDTDADGYENYEDVSCYDEETDSDKTALDSLFVNIPTIKSAIADRKCLHFLYRSYGVVNNQIDSKNEAKSVLPHSLVFNDGKYYLIGIDENAPGLDKVAYFRVDLMFELHCTEPKAKLSNWDKHIFDTIERARVVEKHPLMQAGKEIQITFKVVESALDRVVDAFAVTPDKFKVTEETRMVKDTSGEGFHEEKVVRVDVRTTDEEAFRWALANADVVEVTSQDIRDRIARIAEPVYKLYTHTLPDKVRENIDYVLKEGCFEISYKVDENTAYSTYKELAKMYKLDAVNKVIISSFDDLDNLDYLGEFFDAECLALAPQIKDPIWASKLINVKTLVLMNSQIEDASWMKEMKKLKRVMLTESTVSDLSVLSGHKEISELDIGGTNVRDISFIEDFPNLIELNITACPIVDYTPLFKTKSRLKYLEIGESALKKIGEENIRNRHIGITLKPHKDSPFWFLCE